MKTSKISIASKAWQLHPIGAVILVTLMLPVCAVKAANILWQGGTADYTNASDWVGGMVPGPGDAAINDNGTNNVVQINAGDPNWTLNQIRAGDGAGDGAFLQNGPTLTLSNASRAFRVGMAAGNTGIYTLAGGAINYGAGGFNVGEIGTGILNINGGSISGSGNFADNFGVSSSAVTASMDGGTTLAGTTWFEQGFNGAFPADGLPLPGVTMTNSLLGTSYSFTLAPSYSTNDVVMIDTNVTSATITLVSPTACSALSFLGSAGNGPMTVNYTVHHADATTEAGSLTFLDWFTLNTNLMVFGAGGRVNADGSGAADFGGPGNFPYLFAVNASLADTTSPVTSVDLTYASSPQGDAHTGIMAVSGSTGAAFTPLTITNSYNENMIVASGAVTLVSGTVTDVVNQVSGAINVTGGGQMFVGNYGVGIYNLSGGTIDVHSWIAFGRSGGTGTVNMTGGVLNQDGGGNLLVGTGYQAPVGGSAAGILNQSGGAITSAGQFLVPESSPSSGTYNLSGTGLLVVSNWIAIGRNGGNGVLNMNGGSITKAGGSGSRLDIGASAVGTLNQTNGAITNLVSDTWLGESGTATWNLAGGSATLGLLEFCVNASATATLNLNGGVLQVTGITNNTPGGSINTLSLNGGTLQAGANNAAFISGLFSAVIGSGGAVIDSQGYNITIPQELDDNVSSGLTKNGTGTLTLTGPNTYGGVNTVNAGILNIGTSATGNNATTVADNAGFGALVQAANAQLNVPSLTVGNSTGASLNFDLGNYGNPSLAPLNVAGTFAANGTITVNVADAVPQLGQFPLVKYGTLAGTASFAMGSLPTGVAASVVNDVTNNSIDLLITGINQPRWEGLAGGDWDIGVTTNWINVGTGLPTSYTDGSPVLFNDSALGTTNVNLAATVSPASITVTNSALNYAFVGSGKISGAIGLNKQGSGTLAILNTGGNTYTGPTVIAGGVLSVTNLVNGGLPGPIGASSANPANLVINSGGTFQYAGAPVTVDRGYQASGGTIDAEGNFTLTGLGQTVSGTLVKIGPATMTYAGTGANVLSPANVGGAYQVNNGTVVFDGSAGPQTNSVTGELWVGGTPSSGANLILTNTLLNVGSWLGEGRGNGTINNTSTFTLYNSSASFGNVSLGYWNNIAGNLASQFLTLDNSTLVDHGDMNLAESSGSTATINLLGTSALSSQNRCYLAGLGGGNCHAAMTVANSSSFTVVNGWFSIANNSGSTASLVVQDNGVVTVTNSGTGDFNITDVGAGTATVIITNNGDVENYGGFYVGKGSGSVGELDQYGGTVHAHNHGNQEFQIGGSGTGTYNLYAGNIVSDTKWFAVGRQVGSTGFFNVFGGTVTVNNNALLVGEGGAGTLTITNAGTVTSTSDFIVGNSDGNGTGTVNLSGGLLSVPIVHTFSTNVSTFNFNGGTLQARRNEPNFMAGLKAANVLAGGATIDSGANTIAIAQPLLNGGGDGGLTKVGTGTLQLNGANTYTGSTLVNTGALGGTGSVAGPVTVALGATLAAGSGSIGTFTINSNLTLSAGSMALMKITTATNDQIAGLTAVSYGGVLVVTNTGGTPLTVGSVFKLFNSATAGTGNFTSVTILPVGTGTFDPATGNLTITSSGVLTMKAPVISGSNLILTGNGGSPGSGYTLLTATNLNPPVIWITNTTGVFDGSGAFSNNIPANATQAASFFRLREP